MKPKHFTGMFIKLVVVLVLFNCYSNINFITRYSRLKFLARNDAFHEQGRLDYFANSGKCLSDWKPNKKSKKHPICAQLYKKTKTTKQTLVGRELFSDADYGAFKSGCKQAIEILQDTIYQKIERLQNIKDCSKVPLVVCPIECGHGLASLAHVSLKCFFVALGTNRTMVLELPECYRNVDKVFLPRYPSSCAKRDISKAISWNHMKKKKLNEKEIPVIKTSHILSHRLTEAKYDPYNMPQTIAGPLECCHGNPNAWWIGQLVKYFMRPQAWVIEEINHIKKKIGFSHPIIGIHVRRTDKIKEAQYFELESYMTHAEQWYDCPSSKNMTKKVYLASDDFKVLDEAKLKYPNYVFLSDPLSKNLSTSKENRYSNQGLMEIVRDIMLLKDCDFFIGTFSSNVGRIVHELRQVGRDRSFDTVALDGTYRYHSCYPQHHIAISNYKSKRKGEMEIKLGDKILINPSNSTLITGFGRNNRTGKTGTYPVSKVRMMANTADFLAFT